MGHRDPGKAGVVEAHGPWPAKSFLSHTLATACCTTLAGSKGTVAVKLPVALRYSTELELNPTYCTV